MSAIREDQVCLLCLQSISGSLSYECKTGNETDQSNACYTAMSPDTMNHFTYMGQTT